MPPVFLEALLSRMIHKTPAEAINPRQWPLLAVAAWFAQRARAKLHPVAAGGVQANASAAEQLSHQRGWYEQK